MHNVLLLNASEVITVDAAPLWSAACCCVGGSFATLRCDVCACLVVVIGVAKCSAVVQDSSVQRRAVPGVLLPALAMIRS